MPRDTDDDVIANHVEWTQHRYDPGHYLGGNLPPHLRRTSLGRRGRRRMASLLGVAAAGLLTEVLLTVTRPGWELAGHAVLFVLMVLGAIRMYPRD